jgi:hypothetical protein
MLGGKKMKYRKMLTFVIVYVFLVLIVIYSFSFYRGRQINHFLEEKTTEYKSNLECTNQEIETLEDWASVYTCKAHSVSLEYLIQEIERIRSKKSINPFLPYIKAFSYSEIWHVVAYARADTIDDFWIDEEDTLCEEMEKICEENTCAHVLQTEEYNIFIQEIIESTKTYQGKDIDTIYGEILQEHANPFSLYKALVQEKGNFAKKAYENYKESVNKKDFLGSLVYSRIIFAIWRSPQYKEMLFWFGKAVTRVFNELNINMYVDLFVIFVFPLLLLLAWLGKTKLRLS